MSYFYCILVALLMYKMEEYCPYFSFLIYIALTMPAVSTLAPALRSVSTISTFPLRDAHTSAVVPY